ncbi:MAG: lytic transglycosylase domain-containing protein [SAR324 cluster bacterium]|nr:lytic transglycosylase domain-containing protein [SAR324 cluster bacterium]
MVRIITCALVFSIFLGITSFTAFGNSTNNKTRSNPTSGFTSEVKSKKQKRKTNVHQSIEAAITKASRVHKLPSDLIRALIHVESGGGAKGVYAVSHANAIGLTQLLPNTAREMGVRDPFDIEQNVVGGTGYLKRQVEKFDSLFLGLVAYNWGPRNTLRALRGQQHIPRSVRHYANQIIKAYLEA